MKIMREIDYGYEYPLKAVRFGKWEIDVRKMRKDEMPDDGIIYYVDQNGSIYHEGEKDFKLKEESNMPTIPTLKAQLKEEALKEFDFKWYGQLNCVDDTGGFDAKPYMELFIEKLVSRTVDKTVEEIRNRSKTLCLGEDINGNDVMLSSETRFGNMLSTLTES